jgi:hypothetical protein
VININFTSKWHVINIKVACDQPQCGTSNINFTSKWHVINIKVAHQHQLLIKNGL